MSYVSLWPVYALLHGAYAAGCFVLLRFFFARLIALPVALALALSPTTLGMLYDLHDYPKGPFIIWAIALLLLAIRTERARCALLASIIAGSVLGFGAGFRMDTLVLLPIGVVLLAVGLRPPVHSWRSCSFAVAAFVLSAGVLAAPVYRLGFGGVGSLVMEGATDPFVRFLGVGPSPYSLGWAYSDELTLSTIAADLSRADPRWDAHESEPLQGVTQSITRSTRYFFAWAPFFAADFATHMIKSAVSIAGFEVLISPSVQALDPARWALTSPWYGAVLPRTIPSGVAILLKVAGVVGLLGLLFRVFSRSPREGVCLALLLAFLLTYPAALFSIRNFFHLEVVSWLGLLSIIVLPLEWRRITHAKQQFAVWLIGVAALATAFYGGLLVFQDYALVRQISGLLALPRDAMTTDSPSDEDDGSVWRLPLPERYQSLVSGPTDSLNSALPEMGTEWEVRAAVERMLITVGGPTCPAGELAINFAYRKRPGVFQPLDHAFTIMAPTDPSQRSLLIAPAFYRPTQYLSEISVPRDRKGCISRIERIRGESALPSVFTVTLASDWRDHSLRQTLWK